jgi:hypothetical protein
MKPYVMKLLRYETLTLNDITLSDVYVCYVNFVPTSFCLLLLCLSYFFPVKTKLPPPNERTQNTAKLMRF